MSFNRRGGGPDRRPDRDRHDRPQRRPGGDWQPRDRGGDRPFSPRGGGAGDRAFTPRPRYERASDEGGMSIRLDPRRLATLKRLAAEAGVRPGDLVRQWVEERIDGSRAGTAAAPDDGLRAMVEALAARIDALERGGRAEASEPIAVPVEPAGVEDEAAAPPRWRRSVAARPSGERVALHDEMIAILTERGPMTAAELAGAIVERGRYAPPRSGKPLDAAMVSQRVSNPTYRSRFVRNEGRIGLFE
jgi:hypothetical protein